MGQAQNTPAVVFSGLTASATLAAKQYYMVKLASTAGEVIVGAAKTDEVIGVLQNDAAADEAVSIGWGGVLKVAAEISVNAGDWVTCSTTGRAKTTTTDKDYALGIAIDASSSAGDIIRVLASHSLMSV